MNRYLMIAAAALMCTTVAFAADDEVEAGPDVRPFVFIGGEYIENKTDNPAANFSGLIDRLDFALTDCGVYRVLNSKAMSDGIKADDTFKVAADDGGKESKIETPGFRVYLTVMTYGVAASAGTDMYGKTTETQQGKVELILKIVDWATKETKATKNISATATGSTSAQANLKEQILQETNRKVVADIISELIRLTPFNVLDVENGDVVVDVPASRVTPGQQLTVYKKGKKIKNKRTGKVTAKESQVAVIGVVTPGEDSVTCKLLSGEIKPDEGAEEGSEYDNFIVRIPGGPQAVAVPATPAAPQAPSVPTSAAPF